MENPFVLWITGLPASGKSSITAALIAGLRKRGIDPVVLESDVFRKYFTPHATHSEEDRVLFYHSVVGKEVVGICEVEREHYPDPTADDPPWVAVDLKPVAALKRPVSLEAMRGEPSLAQVALLKQSRLSVMPLAKPEFDRIVAMGR